MQIDKEFTARAKSKGNHYVFHKSEGWVDTNRWYVLIRFYYNGKKLGTPFSHEMLEDYPEPLEFMHEWFANNGISLYAIDPNGKFIFTNHADALLTYLAFK